MSDWPPGMAIRPIQQWPGEQTRGRTYSPFRAKWGDTIDVLRRELRQLNARTIVLQVAIEARYFRLDGYPRADARATHPGVILAFDSKYGPLSYPSDRFVDWQDNVRAIALAMEALRKVDRYGVTKRGEQYTGWKALPAGSGIAASGMTVTDAHAIVCRLAGLDPDDHEQVATRLASQTYASLARTAKANVHPDRNDGDRAQWNLLENATTELRRAGWMS